MCFFFFFFNSVPTTLTVNPFSIQCHHLIASLFLPIRLQLQPCSFMSTDQGSNIFNVQDSDDFKERVLQSKTPTVVDFHAEYVWHFLFFFCFCKDHSCNWHIHIKEGQVCWKWGKTNLQSSKNVLKYSSALGENDFPHSPVKCWDVQMCSAYLQSVATLNDGSGGREKL